MGSPVWVPPCGKPQGTSLCQAIPEKNASPQNRAKRFTFFCQAINWYPQPYSARTRKGRLSSTTRRSPRGPREGDGRQRTASSFSCPAMPADELRALPWPTSRRSMSRAGAQLGSNWPREGSRTLPLAVLRAVPGLRRGLARPFHRGHGQPDRARTPGRKLRALGTSSSSTSGGGRRRSTRSA